MNILKLVGIKTKEEENKMIVERLKPDILNEPVKKTPDELIEDIIKIIDDAGYGVGNVSYKLDCDRNHNINIDIKGCSKYGTPIEVSRLHNEKH